MASILKENDDIILAEAYLYKDGALLYHAAFNSEEILLESNNEKKLKKTLVVKAIHNVLKKHYNVEPDYGILTGVRVIKILITAKNNSKSDDEINRILKDTYEIKNDKIKLLWEILKIESKYISAEQNTKNYNLYVSIPFCPSKCSYCSFTSFVNTKEDKINVYLKSLIYEIEKTIELALKKDMNLNTVYIGGGTPSVLNEAQIDLIFSSISKYYDLTKIKEVTFEAGRPDTLSREKLECLKRNNVSRISINPQTMNEKTLNLIGRSHTIDDVIQKYKLSKEIGFAINMDVILGLTGEDESDVRNTITEIVKLKPENITVHSLSYKKKSELMRETQEMSKDYDLMAKMHEIVNEKCQSSGYAPYYMYRQKNIKGNSENIGFTLPDRECIYNMIIIEELETILACGLGASSKILQDKVRHEPVRNFKSLEEYNSRIHEIINKKIELL
ncbi:coproporphyrinogen dehydrogenase HemZ [Sedimentibacter hydroxybenzoicus DSM 7310]|uniref:Coproporphyrinogen dehydrogenase HemZ n=1 Tax=Sedimentibacter hydroxybenzoicus DSM 7310 TaxID=1123245 RepID=A0A974BM23_SEDHY|nr:coproporphyrinogen dehydrogenase HemZ [Sedimentibacter hydroxybenzoicus DSM 7310]